jgi:hypothetical protein
MYKYVYILDKSLFRVRGLLITCPCGSKLQNPNPKGKANSIKTINLRGKSRRQKCRIRG